MERRAAFFLLLFATLATATAAAAGPAPRLEFSPELWKFGMITRGEKISLAVTIENRETRALTVSLVPTCTCLSVEPRSATISAGGRASFTLRYDSADDVGITNRAFLVRTDLADAGPLYYLMRGTVRDEHPVTGAAAPPAASAPGGGIGLDYYYSAGCRSCEEFLGVEVPRLSKRLGIPLNVTRHDVLDPAAFEELSALAAARGQSVREIPALLAGDTLLQGDKEIRARLASAVGAAAPRAAPSGQRQTEPTAAPVGSERLAVLPVLLAGLIDGINPCAFTTLIFLLASLTLAGRGRREVLIIGGLFTLAVFVTYSLVGFGFFAALRVASSVAIVGLILRWVLFAVLIVFAGMSVYDYTLIRRGRPSEILLQLPTALKRRIHDSIRGRVRAVALAGSSLVLGFLVSIFEFACTAQVYLPTLAYVARVQKRGDALLLLGLYNLCFILPLLVVFAASYLGVSSKRITELFQARMGVVKLALAVVFAGLAVLTLVG